jgi:two-component system NarL family sensor kinase
VGLGRVELAASQQALQMKTADLQRLSAQLLRAQDSERQRIARELHDDLGQQLSVINMMLGAIPPDNSEYARISDAKQVAERAQKSVRNLSYLLRPPLLDEVGLSGSLHWYVEGFSNRDGMKVSLSLRPQSLPRMAKDIEMAIFRIVQEVLANAYRHSGTKNARVDLQV